jgi:hypothetical protein
MDRDGNDLTRVRPRQARTCATVTNIDSVLRIWSKRAAALELLPKETSRAVWKTVLY